MFSNKFYKQIDGVATGSLLGPALANIFICSFENKWLKDCPHGLKPVFCRRYFDDIFVLLSSVDHAETFKTIFSFQTSQYINFSLEKKTDGRLSFLDINIFREYLSLMFMGRRPLVVFVLISTASYLNL